MEGINKNKEQKDDALTAAYMLGRYDGQKEVEARAEKAEDEVVQLKAERRYLANALSSYGDEDEEMSAEDRERSARRAVAGAESGVKG